MVDVEISPRPFTTIKPNLGHTYVRTPCVCEEFGVKCNPKNSKCENGVRLIPVQLLDVAGLVPDAHLGKGLGNQFLNDLIPADGLIHVVDISGKTDAFGNPSDNHDVVQDIEFLENEIGWWIEGILKKNWDSIQKKAKMKKLWECIYEQLAGLGISQDKTKEIVEGGYKDTLDLAKKIRTENKPIILAGNKIDLKTSPENYEDAKQKYEIFPACSEAELALRRAGKSALIKYVPGDADFQYLKDVPENQKKALEFLRESILKKYGGTGVQKVIDALVFRKLKKIVVYPVEDENKLCDKNGNVLPDARLMKEGSTALDLAFKIHTDIGRNFIGAIDCRTKKRIGKEYALKNNDVIKILAKS